MTKIGKMFEEMIREYVVKHGTEYGLNVVAFSGGVDSSVVAACLYRAFPRNSVACIGVSPALPRKQLELAELVAKEDIGIPLAKMNTFEFKKQGYKENVGNACYFCKTTLYEEISQFGQLSSPLVKEKPERLRIFNGTNKDDLEDKTRVGLIAAKEYGVFSPLQKFSKTQVRQVAEELGLRTSNIAASPCLRSRLAMGIEAIEEHMQLVEAAENEIRVLIDLNKNENLRFRMLSGGRFRLEVDPHRIPDAEIILPALSQRIEIDLDSLTIGEFKSGSVAFDKKVN